MHVRADWAVCGAGIIPNTLSGLILLPSIQTQLFTHDQSAKEAINLRESKSQTGVSSLWAADWYQPGPVKKQEVS